ncbi:MAG: hypothetical protein JWM34_4785 [Ilumatobacteraceae bacterium]|nr:hypothetical protein [Ilumatobacteraceae bacterium]
MDDLALAALPTPGRGRTTERFAALWELAVRSPTTGRLGEAHHDALAILDEAGRSADDSLLHAVWAAGGPDPLRLETDGRLRLTGTKHWCSGAGVAQRALVTAEQLDGRGALVLVDLRRDGIELVASDWVSPAFAGLDTRPVHFDLDIAADDIVGVDDWYVRRSGFWHGAVGVAACWAGCIDGIVERMRSGWRDDPHALGHLGAIDATLWSLHAAVDAAAFEIDAAPDDALAAHVRALRVRHIVDRSVGEMAERLTRALGPGPLAHRPDVHLHLAETELYRRQCHAERDLEVLGGLAPVSPPVAPSRPPR